MNLQSAYASKLFLDFRAIHPGNYRALQRFWEQHEADINQLSLEERFVIWCYYANALYGLSLSDKHLELADRILEYSIIHDIPYVDNIDIYTFMLFQKAVSHLRLSQWDKAIRISGQLLRIDPHRPEHLRLLHRCLLAKRPRRIQHLFVLALMLLLLTAACTIGQIFVIESFYPRLREAMLWLQLFAFGGSVVLVGLGTVLHHVYAKRRSRSMLETAVRCQKQDKEEPFGVAN